MLADSMCAARVQPGDRLDLREEWYVERVRAAGCARGCKGADGGPAPATWWHTQFVCAGEAEVEARRAWVRGLEVLPEVLECEVGHDQLAAALAFAKAGLPGS